MSVLWSGPLTAPRLILLGKLKLSYIKITEKATSLKKKKKSDSFSGGLSLELCDFDWFGSCRPWIQNALQTLGIILLKITIVVSFIYYILLNACLQLLTTKQMISLRLEHQKGMKRITDLKQMWTWSCDLWVPQRIHKKPSWPVNTTEQKTARIWAVAGSGAKVLNFDHTTQLSWKSEQKGGNCGVHAWLSQRNVPLLISGSWVWDPH